MLNPSTDLNLEASFECTTRVIIVHQDSLREPRFPWLHLIIWVPLLTPKHQPSVAYQWICRRQVGRQHERSDPTQQEDNADATHTVHWQRGSDGNTLVGGNLSQPDVPVASGKVKL